MGERVFIPMRFCNDYKFKKESMGPSSSFKNQSILGRLKATLRIKLNSCCY